MSKPVILTGLRANNDLHLGNYLGALLPMIDMATKHAGGYQINLFVPDLHSFTTPIDHSKLQEQIMQNVRVFVAAGLPIDNPDIHVYRQSYIPAHSELTWILDCFTGYGQLNRMTQFKDKSGQLASSAYNKTLKEFALEYPEETLVNLMAALDISHKASESVSAGLFNYPVLMAADILLYDSLYVPVGDDQAQHLEFTRDIAERMNNKFGELFTVPEPVKEQHDFFGKDQGLRVRDLADPTKKMSKSDETGKGVIFLSDTPEAARKKIMSATTDSLGEVQYDYSERPGISNLLDIYKYLGGNPEEFIGQAQYGPLKTAVAERVAQFLLSFQEKLAQIDEATIADKLASSEEAMNQVARAKLLLVQKAVGLRA